MRMDGTVARDVPTVDVKIEEDDVYEGAKKVLAVIRPKWSLCEFKLLTDGITNKLVACSSKDGPDDDVVLVRIYGNKTDLLIDRCAETKNILLLNSLGLAPQLFATFRNGLAYEFVPGCTLTPKTVIEPSIYNLVAIHMAKLHKVAVPNVAERTPVLWGKLQKFLNLVPERFSDDNKQRRFLELNLLSKQKLQQEKEFLERRLSELNSAVVFGHNDLLLGNVILTRETNKITFIDYEYAAFNYQAYDIGNHFVEFAGIENPDFTIYPDKQLQWEWLKAYLIEYLGRYPTETEIERLYVQVNQFSLASHLFWGTWCYIQAEHSYIDFDFLLYASQRFYEYYARRDEFLSLEMPKYSNHL